MSCNPDGGPMKIRAAWISDAPALARVHVDSWRSTYRCVLPKDRLAALSYGHREQGWAERLEHADSQRTVTFVAEDQAGQVVGFSTAGPETSGDAVYKGELHAIYLLEAHQRQGHGRRLMHAAADAMARDGFPNIMLWVLSENHGARGFYERIGGRVIRERTVTIFEVDVMERAYGWDDIQSLVASTGTAWRPRDS
jgi:ribosomal protein S18 acetylase RimI-like enzyme